jgi:DNA-binding winged helix-turn-helix (wHTH) protein
MQLCIKVVQSRSLFESVTASFGERDGWANRFLARHGVAPQLVFAAADLRPEDLLCFPDRPMVVLAEAKELVSLGGFGQMGQRLSALLKQNAAIPLIRTPLIVTFQEAALAASGQDVPDFITDWMMAGANSVELAHRILGALRSSKLHRIQLACGLLTILPDSRSIAFERRIARLSPSEFTLAELFLARMGVVVSLAELTRFFDAAGKSTEPNNIRVTIHQLRLKIEELTRSQLRLFTVYRKGYCLRQMSRKSRDEAGAAGVEWAGDD